MKLAADLHIHSALSPCGGDDMTPNNIVNMCCLKGLDVISVTDHNSMLNCKAVMELGRSKGLLVIPGIEVTTKEEVHVLCYFEDVDKGLEFSRLIYDSLPSVANKEEVFGSQLMIDKEDNCFGKVDKLLLSSSSYTINEIQDMAEKKGGVVVPAHIDKSSYSILSALGFIPSDLRVKTVEIYNKNSIETLKSQIKLDKYNISINSDAHYLHDINERNYFIFPKEKTVESIINFLSQRED